MSTVRQLKEVPGLLSCVFSHEVTKTTHKFTWTGPKLNAIWPEILAFFKWTNDTMHSESQVRLFVNATTKEWKAWAFPQQARTSMAAHEITQGEDGYAKAQEQRAQFDDTVWHYWGTVHHHCNMSAFQSGTDTRNEESQDGLHITVGNLDKPTMNIHYRIYQSGIKICDSSNNPPGVPMSTFWDIGDALESFPPQFRHLLRPNIEEELVLLQMGTHPPADTVINQQWKDNVIDITPKAVVTRLDTTPSQGSFYGGWQGHSQGGVYIGKRIFTERSKQNYQSDLEKAIRDTIHFCVEGKHKIEDVAYWFEQMASTWDDDILNMLDIVLRNDVTPDNYLKYLKQEIRMAQAKTLPQQQGQHKGGKGNGKKGGNKQQNQGDKYENLTEEEKEKLLENWEREYYGGVHGSGL